MQFEEFITNIEVGLIYGLVSLGIYLTFRIIDFQDLTCDGSFVLGSAISTILIKSGFTPSISILVATISGGIAGFITGALHTCFRINDLLSGILVGYMLYSLNLRIMGGVPNISLSDKEIIFTQENTIWILLIFDFLICIALSYMLFTDFGLGIISVGQNQILAKNLGVNVRFMTIIGIMLSNGMISTGGAILTQYQGFADVGMGIGTLVTGFASVLIGERLFHGRSFHMQILACVLGSIIYRMVVGFALHTDFLGLETQDLNLVTGIIVLSIILMKHKKIKYVF